jgi:hypothetical protein
MRGVMKREREVETRAHRKRRIMKLVKEEGGGRRRRKVGAYKVTT